MKKIFTIIFLTLLTINIHSTVYYVTTEGRDSWTGTSWAAAKRSVQGAINVASNGDVILVKYGTYVITAHINWSGKNLKISSDDGTANSWETAVPDSSLCILDATGRNCRLFLFSDAAITSSTIISGFKMTGGDGTSHQNRGGAIYIHSGSSPIIEKCWITGNVGGTDNSYGASGGGIHLQDGSPIIQRNLISGNFASTNEGSAMGGGISIFTFVGSSNAIIRNNTILGNIASKKAIGFDANLFSYSGGGIYISTNFNGEISGNIIKNNVAAHRENFYTGNYSYHCRGGGVHIDHSNSATIKNNIFVGNKALSATSGNGGYLSGGAIYDAGSNCQIINNIFYDNKLRDQNFYNYSSQYGQAIYAYHNYFVIKNNIFVNHSSTYGDGRAIYHHLAGDPLTINYNCFYNNTNPNSDVVSNFGVTGNPLFTDAANGDFSLQPSSPCINTGDPTFTVPEGGEPRIDIGAFEYLTETPTTVTNMNDTFDGNFVSGQAFAIAAASGTVDCTVQQHLSSPPNNDAGKPTVGRYWNIESTGNAFIRLYYPSSATATFSGNPTIFHYNGSNWEAIPTNSEETDGNSNYVESTNPVTNWSPFTVGDSNDPLPVELVSFNGNFDGENVVLNWQTATEINNYGFSIERSFNLVIDGLDDWSEIGFVQGSGTTNSPKEYSFTDNLNPNPNLTLNQVSYRLKQIDLDGTFAYSKIVTVDLTTITSVEDEIKYEFAVEQNYPNPFNPTTQIQYSIPANSLVTLIIYDLLGSQVKTLVNEFQNAGKYSVDFNAAGLSSGVYFYRLSAGQFSETRKLLLLR